MTSAQQRPRTVEVAFWIWAAAAVLLILGGLLAVTSTAVAFVRGAGVIFLVAALAVSYLAGRTRRGDKRFRRAAVALALTVSVLLLVFGFLGKGLLWFVAMALLVAGAFAVTRPSADEWFDAVEAGKDGA